MDAKLSMLALACHGASTGTTEKELLTTWKTLVCTLKVKGKHWQAFTAQQVLLALGAVGCGAHPGEVQGVAQHGVHPAEDVRVAAGRQGRRVAVRALGPAGVASLH